MNTRPRRLAYAAIGATAESHACPSRRMPAHHHLRNTLFTVPGRLTMPPGKNIVTTIMTPA